jgi:hypothetical protein
MVTHMKTTIDIADALLEDAKQIAHREGTTLKALIEAGLRREIESRVKKPSFKLRDASVRGKGLHPDVQGMPLRQIIEVTYGRRAGYPD